METRICFSSAVFLIHFFYRWRATIGLSVIWWRDLKEAVLALSSLGERDLNSHISLLFLFFTQWQPFSWIKRGTHWFSHCLNLQLNPPDMSRMYSSVNRLRNGRAAAHWREGDVKRMTRQRRINIMPWKNEVCLLLTLTPINPHKQQHIVRLWENKTQGQTWPSCSYFSKHLWLINKTPT